MDRSTKLTSKFSSASMVRSNSTGDRDEQHGNQLKAQDDDIESAMKLPQNCLPLQQKSSTVEHGNAFAWKHPFGINSARETSSNQHDLDAQAERFSIFTNPKLGALGQKRLWRKYRSQRPLERRVIATGGDIESGEEDDNGVYRLESGGIDSARSFDASRGSASAFARSLTSSRSEYESLESTSSSSHDPSDRPLYSINQNRKKQYVAKLNLPDQKTSLYLGRYKTKEAATAACENAFNKITTPRG